MNKIYYNQADSRWASHPYTAPGYENATCKSAGCGPTCAAMIVSSCKEIIYPDQMCDISKENGYRVSGGTSDGLYSYVANRWGIEMKRVYSSYEAHQACKEGYFVVIACKNGLWTTGGHFILAVGATDSDIEIYDPYLYNGKFNSYGREGKVRLEGNSAWVQIDTFKQYSNAQRFFAFKVGDVEVLPPTESKIMYVNTKSLNLNVRSGAGTDKSIIGSLSKGTQVIVYEESNGWSRIGNGKWVSSEYLSSTPPSTVANTVGQTRKFASATKIWSNSNLSGTRYDYKANTTVTILQNVSASVDKVKVNVTGRVGYVSTSAYGSSGSSSSSSSTVGQTRKTKACYLYSKSNLSGTKYTYKANTTVKILQNVSSSVDKVYVLATGRTAYISTSSYQ